MADNMTREQRSQTMSRIRSKDTRAELTLRRILFSHGLRFRVHVPTLPGKPDIVFPRLRIVVFVDGDFWHGWRFEEWAHKLAPPWRAKIERNRSRDLVRAAELSALGWKVVRIWEHEVEANAHGCAKKVLRAIAAAEAKRHRVLKGRTVGGAKANKPERAFPVRRSNPAPQRDKRAAGSRGN